METLNKTLAESRKITTFPHYQEVYPRENSNTRELASVSASEDQGEKNSPSVHEAWSRHSSWTGSTVFMEKNYLHLMEIFILQSCAYVLKGHGKAGAADRYCCWGLRPVVDSQACHVGREGKRCHSWKETRLDKPTDRILNGT